MKSMDVMDADVARENLARNDVERIQRLVQEIADISRYDSAGKARLRDLLNQLRRAQEEYGIAVRRNHGTA